MLVASSFSLGARHEACDISRPGHEVCEDFCTNKCSFYNESLGEKGEPENITVYRITPKNTTGIQNKDTGNAPGDISFYLARKNLTQQCALDPTSFGCFLDGDNIYGKFTVEIDGRYGPYFECNPINVYQEGAHPIEAPTTQVEYGESAYPRPAWIDTRTFECGQGCLQPTEDDCHIYQKVNGTSGFGGAWTCWCDGTARHNLTVGREAPPFSGGGVPGPSDWVPQCNLAFYQAHKAFSKEPARCVQGDKSLRTVTAWSFESVTALACDACSADKECTGWRTADNRTATLLSGRVRPSKEDCIGGLKYESHYHSSSWGRAGDLGGFWYSTPITAECKPGKPLGTDGCSWRVVEETYRNASCVDGLVDRAVEVVGKACFNLCKQPLNRTSDCYLSCYKNTLLGDAYYNFTAMTKEAILEPWEGGFKEGGCPVVQPAKCEGSQCGDNMVEVA